VKITIVNLTVLSFLMIALLGCQQKSSTETTSVPVTVAIPTNTPIPPVDDTPTAPLSFVLESDAYAYGGVIPQKYTCKGDDISPPLTWTNPPADTQSFALVFDDPDAPNGTWDHWLLFKLPADARALPEAAALPAGTLVGKNSWGRNDYGGPCPPGGTHRYFFRLYALDSTLSLSEGASKSDILSAMNGHILAQAKLMGTVTH